MPWLKTGKSMVYHGFSSKDEIIAVGTVEQLNNLQHPIYLFSSTKFEMQNKVKIH